MGELSFAGKVNETDLVNGPRLSASLLLAFPEPRVTVTPPERATGTPGMPLSPSRLRCR